MKNGMPAKTTKRATKSKTVRTRAPKKAEEQEPLRYVEGVGRRKRAIARVRIFTRGNKEMTVNKRPLVSYFPYIGWQDEALSPLKRLNAEDKFGIQVEVSGSGSHAQAHAVRHGLARALVKFNPDFRKRLKRAGFLMRDARKVERKKPGLKKARRAPQWQKR